MWILRRPTENNLVYCITVGQGEPFTIGRIGKYHLKYKCKYFIILPLMLI